MISGINTVLFSLQMLSVIFCSSTEHVTADPRLHLSTLTVGASSRFRLMNLNYILSVLQVFVSLFVLHGLGVVSFPQPLLVVQLLLQPLLPAQLLQWQPLEVTREHRTQFDPKLLHSEA